MQLGRNIIHRLPAMIACCVALGAGLVGAQEFPNGDWANPFVQDEPLTPPTPYQPPTQTFYVVSDFVGFSRLSPTATFARANRTTTVLSGDDLEYAIAPGLRGILGVRLTDYYALEVGYLGLFDFNEQESVRSPDLNTFQTQGNLFSPFTNFGNPAQPGLDFNNFVSVASETQFNTGELNVRRRWDLPSSGFQATGIWGLRYMSLADRFSYRSRSAVPVPNGSAVADDVNAYNRMFGTQLGGALEMHIERRAWINLEAKGLMLSNAAEQNTQFSTGPQFGPPTQTITGTGSQRRLCLGVDVQASLSWRFSPAIVGRVGYQAIFLEGVALGSDNFEKNLSNVAVDPSELVSDSRMTFHGPFTGLTVTW